MLEALGVDATIRMLVYLMLSLAFFVGIMLIVSQEAVEHFNKALQKEFGLRKKIFPPLEDAQVNFVDWVIMKYRFTSGIIISVLAFILLLIYK